MRGNNERNGFNSSRSLRPQFSAGKEATEIPIKSFLLDVLPVTNGDFLEFVRAKPKWRRSQANRAAADELYLKQWSNDLQFGEKIKNAPVTFVSYYAAKAYAQWRDKRLPTVAEWEYVAAASPTRADGQNDAAFQKQILAWYSSPTPDTLPNVGSSRANIFGVQDLHGLVWEWTGDFYTTLGMAEAVCGGGAKDARRLSGIYAIRFSQQPQDGLHRPQPRLSLREKH